MKKYCEACCQKIDAAASITKKRPWLGTPQQITDVAADLSGFKNLTGLTRVYYFLRRPLDQIALPIAVNQLSLQYKCFDERFNYPAHLKPLQKSTAFLPFLCHYHWHSIIRREPLLNDLVKELANANPLLEKLILNSDEWARLLKPYTLQIA